MKKNTYVQYIIIVFALLTMFIIIDRYFTSCQEKYEQFRANNLNNPNIELLDTTHDDTFTPHTHHHVVHYLSVKEFTLMVKHIKNIIIKSIIDHAESCQQMNGDDKLGDGHHNRSLSCQTDPWGVEEEIVLKITQFIREHIKNKFNINLNHYHIIHDLMRHLNLLEAVIYPLRYSGLFTVHGIQYTSEKSIKQRVHFNLDVKDVLYTIITRRNISLLVDTDRHIQ